MNQFSLLMIFLFFMASCSENDLVTPDTSFGDGISCEIKLSVAPMDGDISTRSTQVSTVNEDLVSNLWAFQFEDASSGGSGALMTKCYVPVGDLSKIEVLLKPNATGKKSNIYFVANVGSVTLNAFSGNESSFLSIIETVYNSGDFLKSGGALKCIPMSGSLLGQTVKPYGIYGGWNVQLVRMLARIDFLYSVGTLAAGKFSLKTIQARNLVNRMAYFPQSSSTFPSALNVEDVLYVEPESATSGTLIPGSSPEIRQLTYYVPENIRGNGNNLSGFDKMKSGIPFATFFELYGEGIGSYLGEKFLIRLYPGSDTKNNYDIKRNSRYVLTANLANLSLSDHRVSKVGSNCYIVKPNESLSIPISRANESRLDLQIPDVYNSGCTASVYWETGSVDGGVVTLSNTSCIGGTFTVKGVSKGNAVVCIKNASGDILWSWHIWVSDVDFKTSDHTITTINNSVTPNVEYVWMDRNLGALDLPGPGKTYATTAGMFYQWGRKDPFIPFSSQTPLAILPIVSYDEVNDSYAKITDFTLDFFTTILPSCLIKSAYTGFNKPKQLLYSVRAPLLFINDWDGSNSTMILPEYSIPNDPWGNDYGKAKTVYDPCPKGWRVPNTSYSLYSTSSPWINASLQPATVVENGNYVNSTGFGSFPITAFFGFNWEKLLGSSFVIMDAGNGGASYLFSQDISSINIITRLGSESGYQVRCVKE